MTPEELRAKWLEEQARMRRRREYVAGAELVDEFLHDFDRVQSSSADESLTLAYAAAESGYSVEHLGRCVRAGAIPNAGRKGAPRILRRDLPRKAAPPVAAISPGTYDPVTDARTLGSRRKGGGYAPSKTSA